MGESAEIVYRLNQRDQIVFINAAWDRFAVANGAGHLCGARVLNRSLWKYVSDPTTQLLYRGMLARARAGRAIRFPFRCDSPERRRHLEMEISLAPDATVDLRVRTLREESRPPQLLWDSQTIRSGDLLRSCSWCKRIDGGGEWVEVEEAVVRLRLLERPSLPMVTHGICERCYEQIGGLLAPAAPFPNQ